MVRRVSRQTDNQRITLTVITICASIYTMIETTVRRRNPNTDLSKREKVIATLATLAVVGGLAAIYESAARSDNPFKTDIPVPAKSRPHLDYVVKPGDTEWSITGAYAGEHDPLAFENMINQQLPVADQQSRTLRPGEHIRLPLEK